MPASPEPPARPAPPPLAPDRDDLGALFAPHVRAPSAPDEPRPLLEEPLPEPPLADRAPEAQETGSQRLGLTSTVCVFRLRERVFALDTKIVSEIVLLDSLVPVPLSPPGVLGLFNLRGTPVALVDLAAVLDVAPPLPSELTPSRDRPFHVLVLRTKNMLAGGFIDRMDFVVPAGRGAFTEAQAGADHPAVRGFLELEDPTRRAVTVLDSGEVVRRLDALRVR